MTFPFSPTKKYWQFRLAEKPVALTAKAQNFLPDNFFSDLPLLFPFMVCIACRSYVQLYGQPEALSMVESGNMRKVTNCLPMERPSLSQAKNPSGGLARTSGMWYTVGTSSKESLLL